MFLKELIYNSCISFYIFDLNSIVFDFQRAKEGVLHWFSRWKIESLIWTVSQISSLLLTWKVIKSIIHTLVSFGLIRMFFYKVNVLIATHVGTIESRSRLLGLRSHIAYWIMRWEEEIAYIKTRIPLSKHPVMPNPRHLLYVGHSR